MNPELMFFVAIIVLILYIWLIYLFVKMSKKVDQIAEDSVSAAYYVKKQWSLNIPLRWGKNASLLPCIL